MTRLCEPWCVEHTDAESGFDICSTELTVLDFGDHGPSNVEYASTHMLFSPDEGLNIYVGFGRDAAGLDVEQAQAVAYAILAQVATARGDKDLAEEFRAMAARHTFAPAGAL